MDDVGGEQWTQSVVEQLTPQAGEYAEDVLHNEVEPLIQNVMQKNGLPGSFNFDKIDFGDMPPRFHNVKTHKKKHDDSSTSVIIDGQFDYSGNCDLRVSLIGIASGVRDLTISGRWRVVLKPTSKKALPFFVGGAQFYLIETPVINFDLDGIADVCDWPIIRQKLRKALSDDINEKIVYPNRITIPLSNTVDPMSFRAFAPIGMLAVKLLFADGLPSKGGIRSLVGQGYPDPYAKVVVGAERHDTIVKKNTSSPSWEDEEIWYEYLLELLEGHRLNIRLFDEDTFSRDEFLGEIFVDLQEEFIVQGAENGEEIRVVKDLLPNENKKTKYEIQGRLSVALRWLPFGGSNSDYPGPTELVVSVFIYSCNNLFLPGDNERVNAYVELRESNGPYPFKSEVKENDQHPNFGFSKTFKFSRDWKEHYITVTAYDATNYVFGSFQLYLAELENNPIQRKIRQISEENPAMTMTLSANVNVI